MKKLVFVAALAAMTASAFAEEKAEAKLNGPYQILTWKIQGEVDATYIDMAVGKNFGKAIKDKAYAIDGIAYYTTNGTWNAFTWSKDPNGRGCNVDAEAGLLAQDLAEMAGMNTKIFFDNANSFAAKKAYAAFRYDETQAAIASPLKISYKGKEKVQVIDYTIKTITTADKAKYGTYAVKNFKKVADMNKAVQKYIQTAKKTAKLPQFVYDASDCCTEDLWAE